jgi:hypothetical protein
MKITWKLWVKEGERRRIWVNVNNPSSPTSSIHENILETLDEGRGEKRIWVNVNNPSSPTTSIHEDILMHTLSTLEQETVRKSKKVHS